MNPPTSNQDREADELPATGSLALYHYRGCLFCTRVLRVIDELGLDVELRDIFGDPRHRDELVAAVGRSTVPVLHIERRDGPVHWMPESADIVRYLRSAYGGGS